MLSLVWHWFELLLALAIVVCGLWGASAGERRRTWFDQFARRRWLSVCAIAALALFGAIGQTLVRGVPLPMVHDEFAYLLQADTFARGRWTNPPHPLGEYFETFHVLQRPTYAGKYPPAQGLFLTLGQVAGGHPIVGVWISFALACGAVCWMLQGWLPPRWALLGAGLMTIRLLVMYGNQQWAYGYWGGAVAALGGALVYGAGRRLWERPSVGLSVVFSLGLGLLANSRPLEGLAVSLPMMGVVAWRMFAPRPWSLAESLVKVVLPSCVVMAGVFALMAKYNHEVTGQWRTMPYKVHLEQYTQIPIVFWQPEAASTKTYAHPVTERFHTTFEREPYDRMQTAKGLLEEIALRLLALQSYFFGYMLSVFVLIGMFVHRRWHVVAWGAVGLGLLVGLQTSWFQAHYLAPAVGLLFYFVALGLRRVSHWQLADRPVGRTIVQLVAASYVLLLVLSYVPVPGEKKPQWNEERQRISQELERDEVRDLVIVDYAHQHDLLQEWAYNGADLDGAPVVWVRMPADQDKLPRLLEYYSDRKVWRLQPEKHPGVLEPLRDPLSP